MSGFTSFAAGAPAAPANPDTSYEFIGFTGAGGTDLTAHASNNTKAATWVSLGTTTGALAGFWVSIGIASSSTLRFLIDFGTDNSTANLVSNLYAMPGSGAAGAMRLFIPVAVGAGVTIYARCQSQTGNSVIPVAVTGRVAQSDVTPPMFALMSALNADTANTRASDTNLTLQASGGTTWNELGAAGAALTTGATYAALMAIPGIGSANPATGQTVRCAIATGTAGNEVEKMRWNVGVAATGTIAPNSAAPLYEASVASGARITFRANAATPGTDALRCAIYGLA